MLSDPYIEFVHQQRTEREKRLLANPRNWFSLIGLIPLSEGENLLGGKGFQSIFVPGLPAGFETTLELTEGKVKLAQPGAGLRVNSASAEKQVLRTDRDEEIDILSINTIEFIIIQRGERFFLRAWDVSGTAEENFTGLNYFPVDPHYRITAAFETFTEPRVIPVMDVIGTTYEARFIGRADFTIGGVECSLVAEEDEDELLFSFTDLTKADSTYPGGRFLTTTQPDNNEVILDFNLANNWPCAYTPHATCPIPPRENNLKVRIEAGEKCYHPIE